MKELIEAIREYEDEDGYAGFEVKTNVQAVRMEIDNHQGCCESWGYLMSEDNLAEFIGAELRNIYVTDLDLAVRHLSEREKSARRATMDEGGAVFVNLDTSKGLLQFTAYNEHNGYYGHQVRITSEQLKLEQHV